MKSSCIAAWLISLSISVWAGEFINLDFNSPNLSNLQTDPNIGVQFGKPQDLVPGWEIAQDNVPIDRVWYPGAGTLPPVTLKKSFHFGNFDGYYVAYDGTYYPSPGVEILKTTSFSQRGTIPAGAETLTLYWSRPAFQKDTPLYINGEAVPIFSDPQAPYDYSADISKWAGQEVTLALYFKAGTGAELDELAFQVIPEPSTWALLGVGLALLAWRFKWRG